MFKVYYGDDTVYEGEPETAPRLNVQALVCPDDNSSGYGVGWRVLHEWDYYIMDLCGRWYGVNGTADLVDHILHECPRVVLKGRMIEAKKYQEILAKAMKDKTNWCKAEKGSNYT